MAKKKDKAGKKAKNNVVEKTEWDDLDVEALEQTVKELKEEHETSLRERIYAQTEHDSIHSYYNATCNESENLDLAIQRIDIEIEEKERENEAELRIYNEKVKHLKYDYEKNLENIEATKNDLLAKEELLNEEEIVEAEKRYERARDELNEKKLFHLEEINQLRKRRKEDIEKTKSDLSNKMKQLQEKCSEHEMNIENELKVKRSAELRQMEEQRNLHMHNLDEQHKRQCSDSEKYCLEIERENQNKLKQLKDECNKVAKAIVECQTQCQKLEAENREFREPLSISLKKVYIETRCVVCLS